ncbi:MAG: trimethylamine methyltransferase family protein [Bacillota bacterium]
MRGLEAGQYRPLQENDIKAIHELSVGLLQDPGVRVNNRDALEEFHRAGAEVDRQEMIVRIPRSMLEDAVDSAPSRVVLCGRDEKNDLILEGRRTYMGTGGTVLNVLDLETGKRRPSTLQDVRDLARIVDALENIHFFMLPVYPNDLEVRDVDINRFSAALFNTTKHVMGGVYTVEGVRGVIKIAGEISGGPDRLRDRPIVSMVTCIMSPLLMDDTYAGLLMEVARQGIPVVCPAEPLAGATGPCTLAGTVAVSNAESLAGVVLAQLVNRGTPTIMGTVATTIDMRTGSYLSGNVEMGLINAACAQMAQYYQIPIYATAGMSDSKLSDIQAGYEKMATAMITALAGANFIHDAAGFLEFCTTASYEQMVIDDEIIGICMRAVRGIDVNEDTLAGDVIRQVGAGGNFLDHVHTMKHCRTEFFQPRLGNRQNRKSWEKKGSPDAARRAREMARDILAGHRAVSVADDIITSLKEEFPNLKLD